MPGILCEHCTAVCCRYIALPIDTPESRADFDDIRWYLLHAGISVFVEDGEWYINMATPCRELGPDHRCAIHATRPNICRKYTTENCDYHSGDYGWEQHFTCPEHLDEYLAAQRSASAKENRNSKRFKKESNTRNMEQSRNCTNSRNSQKYKKNMTRGLRVRLGPARRDVAAAPTDVAGVALPVLGNEP